LSQEAAVSELKTKPTESTISEFLAGVADDQRRQDCCALVGLMREATGVEPVMWGHGIVGFGKYHYRYESGREGDWFVVGFSPRKNDLTLYVIPGFEAYTELLARLGRYKTGKSCLYVKRLADLDPEVLNELINVSVQDMAEKRVE